MKNNTKIVLKSAGFTFLGVLFVLGILYLVMLFCFTVHLADFFYSLGCENLSASLYHRAYEKDNNINYIYKSLNIEIRQNDNSNIIKYYEEFSSDDEYVDFCSKLIEYNESINLNLLEKSLCLDEINTLNTNYVRALWCCDNKEKATQFVLDEFNSIDDITLKDIGEYSLGVIVENLEKECLDDNNIMSSMQLYFENLSTLFSNTNPANDLEKSYLIRLGNRCMSVGIDVNNLYTKNNCNLDKITSNEAVMNNINSKIMELVK